MRGEIYLDGRWVMTVHDGSMYLMAGEPITIRDMRDTKPGELGAVRHAMVKGRQTHLAPNPVPFVVILCESVDG